jgi:NADH-quinone oxidoreductase subunit J
LASDLLLFYLFAAITVLGALAVIGQRNPIYSVMAIVGSFCGLSGLYVLLEAPFVAVVQIIIYAGAILVLFLFTVMLLNASRENAAEWDRSHPYYRPGPTRVGAVMAIVLLGQLVWAVTRMTDGGAGIGEGQPAASSVRLLGRVLFTDYMFAFEVTSILIIAGMVGAVVLAGKKGH